jgi:hypothetical protein
MERRRPWIGLALVAAALVAGSVWFVFVSGYWRIDRVEAYGVDGQGRGELEEVVRQVLDEGPWKPWDKQNIFFVDEEDLASKVQQRMFAERVSVEKSYPNILRLIIVERQRSVVVVSKGQQLLVDTAGIVTGETDERLGAYVHSIMNLKAFADASHVPVIVTDLPERAAAGYQASDEVRVKRWITAYRALVEAKVRFRYMGLDTLGSSLARLKAEDGTDILMDLELPLEPQIDTYTTFIRNKKKDVVINEYIDVRVPGKIYVQ